MANKPIPSGAVAIHHFTVLWEGWECDSKGKVCEFKGERFIVLTNHGSPYRADPSELHDKIAEYKRVIADTEEALRLLNPVPEERKL